MVLDIAVGGAGTGRRCLRAHSGPVHPISLQPTTQPMRSLISMKLSLSQNVSVRILFHEISNLSRATLCGMAV